LTAAGPLDVDAMTASVDETAGDEKPRTAGVALDRPGDAPRSSDPEAHGDGNGSQDEQGDGDSADRTTAVGNARR
jgi:hypothetical protein